MSEQHPDTNVRDGHGNLINPCKKGLHSLYGHNRLQRNDCKTVRCRACWLPAHNRAVKACKLRKKNAPLPKKTLDTNFDPMLGLTCW
jgi:hypothetical protein